MKCDVWALAGLALAGFGCYFVVREHGNLTNSVLIFAGGCIALGFFLMDSTDFKAFLAAVGQYLPWGKHRDGQ